MYKVAQRRRPVILFGIREDSKEDAFFVCARSCILSEGFQVAKGEGCIFGRGNSSCIGIKI